MIYKPKFNQHVKWEELRAYKNRDEDDVIRLLYQIRLVEVPEDQVMLILNAYGVHSLSDVHPDEEKRFLTCTVTLDGDRERSFSYPYITYQLNGTIEEIYSITEKAASGLFSVVAG
jgi:hypothetical protein